MVSLYATCNHFSTALLVIRAKGDTRVANRFVYVRTLAEAREKTEREREKLWEHASRWLRETRFSCLSGVSFPRGTSLLTILSVLRSIRFAIICAAQCTFALFHCISPRRNKRFTYVRFVYTVFIFFFRFLRFFSFSFDSKYAGSFVRFAAKFSFSVCVSRSPAGSMRCGRCCIFVSGRQVTREDGD